MGNRYCTLLAASVRAHKTNLRHGLLAIIGASGVRNTACEQATGTRPEIKCVSYSDDCRAHRGRRLRSSPLSWQCPSRYLCDAAVTPSVIDSQPAVARALCNHIGDDAIRKEQCEDFLVGRTFRRSLLCHQEQQVYREIDTECLTKLSVTGW
jgi:hypothetical protein